MKDLPLSARLAMADNNPDSQEAKLRSVRRRLNFGEANDDDDKLATKEELQRQFAEERAKHLEEKKMKWNFDFNTGQPLPGQWEWEPANRATSSKGSQAANAPAANNPDAALARRNGVQ